MVEKLIFSFIGCNCNDHVLSVLPSQPLLCKRFDGIKVGITFEMIYAPLYLFA